MFRDEMETTVYIVLLELTKTTRFNVNMDRLVDINGVL